MRRVLALGIAAIAAGCATPPPIEDSAVDILRPTSITVDDKNFDAQNIAALWNGGDGWLEVGNTRDHAEELFKPTGAKLTSELPPTLLPEQFKAWGWENKKTGVSFGCIYDVAKKRVVLAMETQSGKELAAVQALVVRYKERLNVDPVPVGDDPRIQLNFWTPSSASRVMICAVTNKSGGYTVTTAAGLAAIMDAIDASADKASDFIKRGIDALEGKKKTETQPQTANQAGS